MAKQHKKAKFNVKHIGIFFICLFIVTLFLLTYFSTYSEFVSRIDNASVGNGLTGISNNTVVLDDLKRDYYYYKGINYTYSSNNTYPTAEDKELYDDTNLVQTKITYFGRDINSSNVNGHVSDTEREDKYIYYKVYPVNDNGTSSNKNDDYIEIELIDNPFSDRPKDMGFNGWVTNYSGATTSLDVDYYVRYAKVPVTYTNNIPDVVDISFYASWVKATIAFLSEEGSFANAFSEMETDGMKPVETSWQEPIYEPRLNTNLYTQVILERNESCRGLYNTSSQSAGNNRCTCNAATCEYYERQTNGGIPVDGETYYTREVESSWFTTTITFNEATEEDFTQTITGYNTIYSPNYSNGANMAGYFVYENVPRYDSVEGYYTSAGIAQHNTCTTNNGCNLYRLIQYNDSDSTFDNSKTYYYFVTRDTNLIIFDQSMTNAWGTGSTRKATITGIYDGERVSSGHTWTLTANTRYIKAYNDLGIEYIRLYQNTNYAVPTGNNQSPGNSSSGNYYIYGNYQNFKMGRGMTQYNNYLTASSLIGANNSPSTNGVGSSSNNVAKYRLMIESGFYQYLSLTNGNTSSTTNIYLSADCILGNDYDRADSNNITRLKVAYSYATSWGGVYRRVNTIDAHIRVKSGQIGEESAGAYSGLYAGGRGNVNGNQYITKEVNVEGGYVVNLIGGPSSDSSMSTINDSYLYVTGGKVGMIFGGAGETATYGNRIIQVTGGEVTHSIFGGSNGYLATGTAGTIVGSSYVYVGGNAIIGDEDVMEDEEDNDENMWYGAEAGSVFGIGNGNENSDTIGSTNSSRLVVADEAIIRKNVYGGGNHAAVGVASSSTTTTQTQIRIIGGNVKGSVFGGGNENGSGDNGTTATVDIIMTTGTIYGSLYGGSNEEGTIYGDVNLNVTGGTVSGGVFGGGLGGVTDESNGTFVSCNVSVTIGDASKPNQPMVNYVYGGSSMGTVNGTASNNTYNANCDTSVTVNNGTIGQSVFGGGQGSENQTPYVKGDVTVTVNNGKILSPTGGVFGGNDKAGMPSGSVEVDVNDGQITNVFGGGNQTDLTTSDVEINGGTITNVFGGSNSSGVVTLAQVDVSGGTITNVYGGNNEGTSATSARVDISGGTITNAYGGGKLAPTSDTILTITGGTITSAYGGGESANITTSTTVNVNGGTTGSVFGGSNQQGSVPESHIYASNGTVGTIYGGNNEGGSTSETDITVNGAKVAAVYGGGNQADTDDTSVNIASANGMISEVYGGGKAANVTNASVNVTGARINKVFGGSNRQGTVNNTVVTINQAQVTNTNGVLVDVYFNAKDVTDESQTYSTITTVTVDIHNATDSTLSSYSGSIIIPGTTELYEASTLTTVTKVGNNYNYTQAGPEGANAIGPHSDYSFSFKVLSNTDKDVFTLSDTFTSAGALSNSNLIGYVYGGNNAGGTTVNSTINVNGGMVGNVYGGGDAAPVTHPDVNLTNALILDDVYGGGNQAQINGNADVDIDNSKILGNVFGGGNAGVVTGNTLVNVTSSYIEKSVHGGGNGATAIVQGNNTTVNIDGTSEILKHVFGGGNAAANGLASSNNANVYVNIVGGRIGGNVYGGANTSVIYGTTYVNIGYNAVQNNALTMGDVIIHGTIFGGGESNASGNPDYDYSFKSVKVGINILIDGSLHNELTTDGSVFGSGNASESEGYSYITIRNYGTFSNYKHNISIQRTDVATIDNSAIYFEGIDDSTNDYPDLFALSRIGNLKLKNNSTIFLYNGTNLLQEFNSLVDVDGQEVKARVTIDEDGNYTRNVDNRVYIVDGKNMNVATSQDVTSFGEVHGMSFLGMFKLDRNGNVYTAYFDPQYDNGDTFNQGDLYFFTSGSYVIGKHHTNHDIKIDGFYSNYDEDPESRDNETCIVKYVEPTPPDGRHYKWSIGAPVESYDVSIQASKYITLGATSLPLINDFAPNSEFLIVGFDDSELNSDINLVPQNQVPRIASSSQAADTTMSLVLKNGTSGWMNNGSTTFLTNANPDIVGTTEYDKESTAVVPNFMLYLYHSKNIATTGDMGKVVINLVISTPTDDLHYAIKYVNINITLSRALVTSTDYEGTIAPGKQYEMFANEDTYISSKSSFSTYYTIYYNSTTNPYAAGANRVLVSNYVFPENTKITMIDFLNDGTTQYYYHIISAAEVTSAQNQLQTTGDISYHLNTFIKMGSTDPNNHYDDAAMNNVYFDPSIEGALEEFIFIVDFSEANITENALDKQLLIELQDSSGNTTVSVYGSQQLLMKYNAYINSEAPILIDADMDKTSLYPGESTYLTAQMTYDQKVVSDKKIYEDKHIDDQMGIKISILDSNGKVVKGSSLIGLSFTYGGTTYWPRVDGTTRIHVSNKVANVTSRVLMHLPDNMTAGTYTVRVETFGCADGIYYGLEADNYDDITLTVMSNIYSLTATIDDHMLIINKETGLNLNGNNILRYQLNYSSLLNDPKVLISLYRRDYSSIYNLQYNKVDLQDYVTTTLTPFGTNDDYQIATVATGLLNNTLEFKDNLVSGTYRLTFSLYDGQSFVGDIYKYIFIK